MVELVPLERIRPSTYNPRLADSHRLQILELSLRKLGFLLPLFVTPDGEILSGHQRYLIAERLGLKKLPVHWIPEFTDGERKGTAMEQRKGLNIAFNRGTNDMRFEDSPKSLTEALSKVDLDSLAKSLPDTEDWFPCLQTEEVPTAVLTKANAGRWIQYSRNVSIILRRAGIRRPVVCTPDHVVVNGIGRVEDAAEEGEESLPVVYVQPEQAEFARVMLNFLTMDFDIHRRYENEMRYAGFWRPFNYRHHLGRCFTFPLIRSGSSKDFDLKDPENQKRWIKRFGRSVVDFGAGRLTQALMLRAIGVEVAAFEPFHAPNWTINREKSVRIAREFLNVVGSGKNFNSIFVSAVLNTIPFEQDRHHVLKILASLCGPKTGVYSVSPHIHGASCQLARGVELCSSQGIRQTVFLMDYEKNVTCSNLHAIPQVQKWFSPDEYYNLWSVYFERVRVTASNGNNEAICMTPKPVSDKDLVAALRFEFDLLYPDGERMGLAKEAVAAWEKRLGRKLTGE